MDNDEDLILLEREIDIMKKVHHPNVIFLSKSFFKTSFHQILALEEIYETGKFYFEVLKF